MTQHDTFIIEKELMCYASILKKSYLESNSANSVS